MMTSFDVLWYDCGPHHVSEMSMEKTTVSRNRNEIRCVQYDGQNQVLKSDVVKIDNGVADVLFSQLSALVTEIAAHPKAYDIFVCDGWRWRLRIHNSDRSVQIYEGTVCCPDAAKPLSNAIRDAMVISVVEPMLFGWHADDEN